MPHPNSLMYNVYVVPFWPMKVFWTVRKATTIVFIRDFPTPPDGHPDTKISRAYFNLGLHH